MYWQIDSAGAREYFGCAFPYNHRYSLGSDVQQVRLAGYRVAVATGGGSFVTISVFYLRNGHARDSSDIENVPNHDQPTTTDLVLKSDGAVAWIVTNVDGNLTPPGAVVGRLDSRGEATLATGNDIRAHSLRLQGSTLSWDQAGTTQTSTLR